MRYAWFSSRALDHASSFILGAVAYKYLPEYAFWLLVPLVIISGFAKNTDAANEIWMRRKR